MPKGEQRPGINVGNRQAERRMFQEAKRIDASIARRPSDPQIDRNLEVYNARVRTLKNREAAKKASADWQSKKSWTVGPNGKISEVEI